MNAKPEHTMAVLDCAIQLGDVLELLENGLLPHATASIHAHLNGAYDALLALVPDAEHDDELGRLTTPEEG